VQVGTSCVSLIPEGTDYAFASLLKRPRIASFIDLSFDRERSLSLYGISRYGAIPTRSAEGFPRHYPPSIALSLRQGSRLGLRRYERVRAICLPDKEFRYLRQFCYLHPPNCGGRDGHFCRPPHVAMGLGLYLQHALQTCRLALSL
jgi:hypothetical protein